MKQKDILLIVVIGIVSGVASLLLSGKIFVTPANRQQKVEVVDAISTQFTQPDKAYFNSQSIDPTKSITPGATNNSDPFNGDSGQ